MSEPENIEEDNPILSMPQKFGEDNGKRSENSSDRFPIACSVCNTIGTAGFILKGDGIARHACSSCMRKNREKSMS